MGADEYESGGPTDLNQGEHVCVTCGSNPTTQPTVFHCTSRAVGGQFLFDELDKQRFGNLIQRTQAGFQPVAASA